MKDDFGYKLDEKYPINAKKIGIEDSNYNWNIATLVRANKCLYHFVELILIEFISAMSNLYFIGCSKQNKKFQQIILCFSFELMKTNLLTANCYTVDDFRNSFAFYTVFLRLICGTIFLDRKSSLLSQWQKLK